MRKLLYLALLLLAKLPLQAQQVNVSAVLDSASMLIGDQTTLHLFANHPNIATLEFPGLLNLGSFEMLEMGTIDTLKKGTDIYLQQDILVSAYDSGFFQIPPQRFLVKHSAGTDTIYSNPVAMRVHWIQGDSTELADIKEIKAQPFTKSEIFRFALGVAIIAAFFLLLYFVLTRRRKKEVVAAPEVIIPAHITALAKLETLKKAELWQLGKVKEYYSQLTFVVREYLENRYKILALESTTEEIIKELRQKDFSDKHKQKLREVLQSADLVKFAKFTPPADLHGNAMHVAEDFIMETKEAEVEHVEAVESLKKDNV